MREASGPGKPAMLVDLDRDGHRIVGIDLSGSDAFIGAVLTLDGDIVVRLEAPVPTGADDVVETVVSLARELVAQSHAPVLGIGVGTPASSTTTASSSPRPNLGWVGFDLEGALRGALDLPVLVANDANAAVLAEYTFGGSGDDVLLVKVGRGVGSGLLAGGQPMRGPLRRGRDRPCHGRHRWRTAVRLRQGRMPRSLALGPRTHGAAGRGIR